MNDSLKLAAVLVVVAAAAWAFWFFRSESSDARLEYGNEGAAVAREEIEGAAPRRANIPDRPLPPDDDLDRIDGDEPDADSPPVAIVDPALEVTIAVEILGLDGKPWPIAEGELRLQLWPERGDPERRTAELKEGRLTVTVPAGMRAIQVEEAAIGAERRLAQVEGLAELPRTLWADGSCEVRMRLMPRVLVRALDAGDRRELRDVKLVRALESEWSSVRTTDLASAKVLAAGDSPLVVDVTQFGTNVNYWLLAPEHAATLLHFARDSEGARLVVMEGGGDLDLTIEGDLGRIPPELQPFLRIYRHREEDAALNGPSEDGLVLEERIEAAGRRRFAALPAAELEVVMASGERWGAQVELARASVRIEPGRSTELTLAVDAGVLRVRLAEISGTIIRPGAAGTSSAMTLKFECRDPGENHPTPLAWAGTTMDAARPEALGFSGIKLAPGPYRLSVEGEIFDFDVPEGGRDDLVFTLAAREVLELILRLEGSDRPVERARVSWSAGGRHGSGTWDEARGAVVIGPPVGPVDLMIWWDESFHNVEIEHRAGQKRLELVLPKTQSFILVLKCEGLVIPHDFNLPIEIRDDQDQPVFIKTAHSDGDSVVRDLARAGRYRLEVTKAPQGYRSRGAVQFDLKPGESKEVVVELEVER